MPFNAAVPVLVSVTVCTPLACPTVMLPKERLAGAKLTTGAAAAAAVPLTPIATELLLALEVIVSVALRVPLLTVGVNVTFTVHEVFAAMPLLVLQVPALLMPKSPELAPLRLNALNCTAAEPVLLTVSVCAALVVLMGCALKLRLAGLTDSWPVALAVPVPVSVMMDGCALSLCAIVRVALRLPLDEGVNTTSRWHDPLGATIAPAAQVVLLARL